MMIGRAFSPHVYLPTSEARGLKCPRPGHPSVSPMSQSADDPCTVARDQFGLDAHRYKRERSAAVARQAERLPHPQKRRTARRPSLQPLSPAASLRIHSLESRAPSRPGSVSAKEADGTEAVPLGAVLHPDELIDDTLIGPRFGRSGQRFTYGIHAHIGELLLIVFARTHLRVPKIALP